MKKIITASEAKEIAIGENSNRVNDLLILCNDDIQKEAEAGKLKTTLHYNSAYFSNEVIEMTLNHLRKLGYITKKYDMCFSISWA